MNGAEKAASMFRAGVRIDTMSLSEQEVRDALDFLCGYEPDGVNAALDNITRRRADAIKRAVTILEA